MDTPLPEIGHDICDTAANGLTAKGKTMGRPKGAKNKFSAWGPEGKPEGWGAKVDAVFVEPGFELDSTGAARLAGVDALGRAGRVGAARGVVGSCGGAGLDVVGLTDGHRPEGLVEAPSSLVERYMGPGGIPSAKLANERSPFMGREASGAVAKRKVTWAEWYNRPLTEREYAREAYSKEQDKLEFLADLGEAERRSWAAVGSAVEAGVGGSVGSSGGVGGLEGWTDTERILWGFPVACGDHWGSGVGLWGPLGTGPVEAAVGSSSAASDWFMPMAPEGWSVHRGNAGRHGEYPLLVVMQRLVDDTFAEFGLKGPVLSEVPSVAMKGMLPVYSQAKFTEIVGLPEDWYVIQHALPKSHNDCYPIEWFNDICALLEKMDNPTRREALHFDTLIAPQFQSDFFCLFVKNCHVKGGIGRRKLKKKPILFYRIPDMQYGVIIKSTLRTEHCIVGHNSTIGLGITSQIDIYGWIQWFRCDLRTKLLSLYPEVSEGGWKPHAWLQAPNRIWWTDEEDIS